MLCKRTVYGIGYDTGGVHQKHTEKGTAKAKVYQVWRDMLRRGYSQKYKDKHNTYIHCTVAVIWHDFQVFGDWFILNYKEGFCLDKDTLVKGNLQYSEAMCRFIPYNLNLLLTNRVGKCRNSLPLGVNKLHGGRYITYCNNGKGKTINLGTFDTVEESANSYKRYKENLIKVLAEKHYLCGDIDIKIRDALMEYEVTD